MTVGSSTLMRALVKTGLAPENTVLRDVDLPVIGSGEVLLKVSAVGVCGSDIHAWRSDVGYEWVLPPVVLGHEISGVVAQVGADVDGWSVGDKVVVVSIQGCLECETCRVGWTQRCAQRRVIGLSYDGGMAEYVRVSGKYLVPIPKTMSPVVAAAVEPLSVAAHATLTVGAVAAGDRVVVSGAGFVGIGCALLAREAGAEVVLVGAARDAASRLPAAAALGLTTHSFDQRGWGSPDVWIEASGASAALAAAVEDTRVGGRISVVGLYSAAPSADLNLVVRREIGLRGSYASAAVEYLHVIDLLASGRIRVDTLLETFELETGTRAFDAAAQSKAIKPVIVPVM
jgi:L-iditol 2-dehydrogenase